MGGVCSAVRKKKSAEGFGLKLKKRFKTVKSFRKTKVGDVNDQNMKSTEKNDSGEPRISFLRQLVPMTPPRKTGHVRKSYLFGKVGIAGLEKAVEVLDVLGSGVANLNSSGLISGTAFRGNKISVLAFEVANTITRGASLMQSLSEENVRHVKKSIFNSEGVQCLVSTDVKVLQSIAASDKREELEIFCREVIRFGDLCKDPQWHNLDRFFSKLESQTTACTPEKADQKMCDLTILAQHTAELYHELNTLDRFEQDCRQQCEEAESFNLPCQESLVMLQSELKKQKRLVMSLKRKSLWSKRMEEVMEKLVDVVIFIHHQISESFESIDVEVNKEPNKIPERLGAEGLALHYAKVINQIDNIASRPSYLPPSTRDSLYRGLPASVKNALHCSLRRSEPKEELSVPQIKAEMGKTLDWLVPMATSTSKLYQGFGWVGEWATTRDNPLKENDATTTNLVRLETLYHADKEKTDGYILDLVKWLHHLITAVKRRDYEDVRSLRDKTTYLKKSPPICLAGVVKPTEDELSKEERNLIEKVSEMQHLPICSKSQRLTRINRRSFKMKEQFASSGTSPCRELNRGEAEEVDERTDLDMLRRLYLVI